VQTLRRAREAQLLRDREEVAQLTKVEIDLRLLIRDRVLRPGFYACWAWATTEKVLDAGLSSCQGAAVGRREIPSGERVANVLITGSTDGLGLMAAELLLGEGHAVTLHARNEQRAADVSARLPTAAGVLIGDLSSIEAMRSVAEQANAVGRFDAVIHNAGVGYREAQRIETADGLAHVFAINVLAPYLVTALMTRPERLVYLSSGLARGGDSDLSDPQWEARPWDGFQAYSDSKLFDLVLAFGVARRWSDVRSNSVEPGWVSTKMGGPGAPDDILLAPVTQAWLAVSNEPAAGVTGQHFFHQRTRGTPPSAHSTETQDALLDYCAALTGTPLPI